jgi:hypothetical protein
MLLTRACVHARSITFGCRRVMDVFKQVLPRSTTWRQGCKATTKAVTPPAFWTVVPHVLVSELSSDTFQDLVFPWLFFLGFVVFFTLCILGLFNNYFSSASFDLCLSNGKMVDLQFSSVLKEVAVTCVCCTSISLQSVCKSTKIFSLHGLLDINLNTGSPEFEAGLKIGRILSFVIFLLSFILLRVIDLLSDSLLLLLGTAIWNTLHSHTDVSTVSASLATQSDWKQKLGLSPVCV